MKLFDRLLGRKPKPVTQRLEGALVIPARSSPAFAFKTNQGIEERGWLRELERTPIDYRGMRERYQPLPVTLQAEDSAGMAPHVETLDLNAAGTDYEINAGGDVIHFAYATDRAAVLFVKLDSPNAKAVPFPVGQSYDGIPFGKLYVTWDALAGATGYLTLLRQQRGADFQAT